MIGFGLFVVCKKTNVIWYIKQEIDITDCKLYKGRRRGTGAQALIVNVTGVGATSTRVSDIFKCFALLTYYKAKRGVELRHLIAQYAASRDFVGKALNVNEVSLL